MAQNLRTIIDTVLQRAGFGTSASYAATSQEFALANQAALKLREMELTRFRKAGSITLTGAATYALPSDMLSYLPDTAYQSSNVIAIIWPTPPELWARLKAGDVVPGNTIYVRQLAGLLAVHNSPSSGTLNFEYLSNADITDSSGVTPKERFTVDTDLWQGDDELLTLETAWRFEQRKGIDVWQLTQAAAVDRRNIVRFDSGGARTLGPGLDAGPPYRPWVNQSGWTP